MHNLFGQKHFTSSYSTEHNFFAKYSPDDLTGFLKYERDAYRKERDDFADKSGDLPKRWKSKKVALINCAPDTSDKQVRKGQN